MLALTAVGAIAGLTLVLASLLVLANKKLYVVEDPRIDIVEDMLPLANCGACGVPGCRQFAEALVQGEALPGKCTVSNDDGRARIASFLGVDVGAEEKRVARVACQGGANVARNRAHYDGLMSCRAAAQVAGGGKGCVYGCLGLDDCCEVCDFDAIHMNEQSLPVVDEDKCTACGDCVEACPKDLISLHPASHRLWVACRSLEEGDELLEDCEVGCTACGRCAMDAPGLISMQNNLAVVDYTGKHATRVPIERCPTGAIIWIDPVTGTLKGAAAKKIIRKKALGDAPT
ncbi:MAG: RnfABCDGE type electron transport complex subunit B [Deltaproteobacteria bacterium]|nr:RnfABCDGE type electron transport complex subunit B [Deltaproteobacteria bacterium]